MESNSTLHIISFHEPYPPNFGGVIDVFYKIKSLKEQGIDIILHTFTDKYKINTEPLRPLVKKLYVYPRKMSWFQWIEGKPFSVFSRYDKQLLKNLSDQYPILFDGLQTTAVANQLKSANRKLFLRMHNVEWVYYQEIAKYEKNVFKRAYLLRESFLLKQYEQKILSKFDGVFCISLKDEAYFSTIYPNAKTYLLPPFHGFENSIIADKLGKFVLYHGNLEIAENEHIASNLIQISNNLNLPLVIAGKNPSQILLSKAKQYPNAKIIANSDDMTMSQLLQDAQIQVVAAGQGAGVKLKMIAALHSAKWIVTNENGLPDLKCAEFCIVENNFTKYVDLINNFIVQLPSTSQIEDRFDYINANFLIKTNSQIIVKTIFG
jgi:hypothetical protein